MGKISPLFAVKADKLLDQGLIEEAISMIEEGLVEYPDYPAAKAVLAKAYKFKGDDTKAKEVINDAVESQTFSKTVLAVRENLDNIELSPISTAPTEPNQIINIEEIVQSESFDNIDFDNSEIATDFDFNAEAELNIDEIGTYSIENLEAENVLDNEKEANYNFQSNTEFDHENINGNQDKEDLVLDEDEKLDSINNFDVENLEIEFNQEFPTESDEIIPQVQELPVIPMIRLLDKNPNFDIFTGDKYLYMPSDFNPFDNNFTMVNKGSIIDWNLNFNNPKNHDDIFGLAHKLEGAKIKPIIEKSNKNFSAKPPIMTETIANIYVQQGAFKEAAEAYELLIIKNPDKKDYFQNKIDEIKTLI